MGPTPTAIAVAVVQRGDEFLIGQRPEGAALAGYWEFPGGKVERHETPEEAAVRECWEEAGISIAIDGAYPQQTHEYAHGCVQLFFFACHPLDLSAAPRHPFRWVRRGQLSAHRFPAGNQKLLDILVNQSRKTK